MASSEKVHQDDGDGHDLDNIIDREHHQNFKRPVGCFLREGQECHRERHHEHRNGPEIKAKESSAVVMPLELSIGGTIRDRDHDCDHRSKKAHHRECKRRD